MEELDLTKVLKVRDRVYSPIHGYGIVDSIDTERDSEFPIRIKFDINNVRLYFTNHGFFFGDGLGECVLFPSKEERDWSKNMQRGTCR